MLKSDVLNFVSKCKERALEAVLEPQVEILSIAKNKHKHLKHTMETYMDFRSKLEGNKDLDNIVSLYITYGSVYSHSKLPEGFEVLLRVIALESNKDVYKEEREALGNLQEKYTQVSHEYRKLYNHVDSFRSASKGVEYLRGLGFDTSSIKEKLDVDTHNLFVCGDNKPKKEND